MNRRFLLSCLCLPFLSLGLSSCQKMMEAKSKAEAAIVVFHQRINEGKFKEIYADCHADFKAATSEAELTGILERFQGMLGKYSSSTQTSWHVNTNNGVTTVDVTEKSKFEHDEATEVFKYREDNGAVFLLSYEINTERIKKDKASAEAAILEFHQKFNEGKFAAIYAACHPEFKAASTEAQLADMLQHFQSILGKHSSSAQAEWKASAKDGVTTLEIIHKSKFERDAATETFTYRVDKDACSLLSYHIKTDSAPSQPPVEAK